MVFVDRYSGWPIVQQSRDGSSGLVKCLREIFVTYGIADELSSDGGPEFTAEETQQLLSNGEINLDKFQRGMLQYRNTPDRDTGLSPAQMIFGRPIKGFIPILPGRKMYNVANSFIADRKRYRCIFKVSFHFRGSLYKKNVLLTLFLQIEVSIPATIPVDQSQRETTNKLLIPALSQSTGRNILML